MQRNPKFVLVHTFTAYFMSTVQILLELLGLLHYKEVYGGGNVSGSDVFKSIFIVHQNSGRYNHASFSIPLMGTTEKLTSVFVPYMKNEKCC